MQSLRPCATLSVTPSLQSLSAQSRSQSTRIAQDSLKKLKSTNLGKFHERKKPRIYYFNLYLQLHVNAGAMEDAQKLFDEMPERTLISWTILMSGYARHRLGYEALVVFQDMLSDDRNGRLRPDSFVYSVVLRACASEEDLRLGRAIHGHVLKREGLVDGFVENALVNMYASCGSLEGAAVVFDRVRCPDLVAWSSLLNGYVKNGYEEEGLRVFFDMICRGVEPDAFALSMVIGACGSLECRELGVELHSCIVKMGLGSCLFLENSLMDFYAKCGDLEGMRRVFDQMAVKDLVSWNTVITGYVQNFNHLEALNIFRDLMDEISHCDDFTLTCVLKAVSQIGDMDLGREVHGYILRAGLVSNHYVISSLLDMYIECINHESSDPRGMIPLKICNYVEEGVSNGFIIASMLKWCSLQSDLDVGEGLHSSVVKLGLNSDPFVISSLIDMYSKCGIPQAGLRVFLRLRDPGIALWSALISGYSWNGWFGEALTLFRKMQFDCVEANEFTFTSALQACLALGDVKKAREVHCKILKTGFGSNVSVVNALIILYSELCRHKQALNLCSVISDDRIPWNSLIQACCKANEYEIVHKLLKRIQLSRACIDHYSAAGILNSCASPVLLSVGRHLHAYMTKRGLNSDSAVGNSLIRMYSECGEINDAIVAFNALHERNSQSWTYIISTKVDHGHPAEALSMFKEMKRKNKALNPNVFESALKACAQMQLVDEARHLFKSMEGVDGIKPSDEHFSCMVDVFGRAEMFEEVQEFINKVIPLKLGTTSIWNSLLSSCRIHGNMKLAKYAIDKILEVDPHNCSANLLLQQVLLMLGKWSDASKLKLRSKIINRASSSQIGIQNKIYEFVPNQRPVTEVSDKLAEIENKMEEMGYIADRNHLLHDAEEEAYSGAGLRHTEMKAVAFGIISLPNGAPVRVVKSTRMCGDCHSACKFISTFMGRELLVKDPCNFHHFRDGKCSCRDEW